MLGGFVRSELLDLLRKIMYVLMLTLLCIGGETSEGFAASTHEIEYFKSYEAETDGEKVLRLEFGLNRDGLEYESDVRFFQPNVLELDLKNTIPGRLRHEKELNGIVKSLKVQQVELKRTKLQLEFDRPAEEVDYKIYTLPAEKKAKKKYRLVIDINKSGKKASGTTKGVKGRTIVLDPGHGGSDAGAIGPTGLTEKEVTLAVARKTRDILKNSGAKVVMTRDTDKDVYGVNASARQELQARVNVSLGVPETDVFVSIHCNAFSSPSAHGTESYHFHGSRNGQRLAEMLNEELLAAGGLMDRGVKGANFYVLKHSAVPASLVELAFISNYKEEKLLADDAFQSKLAMAIAKGIGRYFGE